MFSPGYSFLTRLSWGQMRERLNSGTAWRWRDGDSAWIGDYLSARPVPTGSYRLYAEQGYYVLEMRKDACVQAWHDVMVDQILPLLDATDIKPNSGFD